MNLDLVHILHQTFFGAVAAVGFGVLFNVGLRSLGWCFAAGAIALFTRTVALDAGWSLEGASFAAAIIAGTAVQLLPISLPLPRTTLAVTGCIPMVPGSFAAKAIIGLFALTAPDAVNLSGTIEVVMQFGLRVAFTIGALGAGIAIPTELFGKRDV